MQFALGEERRVSLSHELTIHIFPAEKSSAPSADTATRASGIFTFFLLWAGYLSLLWAVVLCKDQHLFSLLPPFFFSFGCLLALAIYLSLAFWVVTGQKSVVAGTWHLSVVATKIVPRLSILCFPFRLMPFWQKVDIVRGISSKLNLSPCEW